MSSARTPGFIYNEKPKTLCPKGHETGTRHGRFRCKVDSCGKEEQRTYKLNLKSEVLDLDKLAKMEPAQAAQMQRLQLAGVPKNLKPEDAKRWAELKLQEMLPEAVSSLLWDMRYGTDKQRAEATDKVMRANGMDKRDAGTGVGGTIILNFGGGDGKVVDGGIPWLKRTMPKPEGEE